MVAGLYSCEHTWNVSSITPQLEVCHCGVVRSRNLNLAAPSHKAYADLAAPPPKEYPDRAALRCQDQRHQSHAAPWAEARATGKDRCFWCRGLFTAERPPTFDHVRPVSRGGRRQHGIVLACQTCNSARSDSPFDEYLAAVEAEREACLAERREYRRPKVRHRDGVSFISTLTRREWREHLRASA